MSTLNDAIADIQKENRKPLPVFEIEVAKKTAQRIREFSGEVSRLSWALDHALREFRNTDPEDILAYSERIGQVLIAQRDVDLFMTKHIRPEIVEPAPSRSKLYSSGIFPEGI